LYNQLFENLFRYAPDGAIVPAGATSLDISPDGTVYIIHLRTDAKWSDGEFVVAKHYIDGILRLGGTDLAFYFFPILGFEEWSAGTLDPESEPLMITRLKLRLLSQHHILSKSLLRSGSGSQFG
jgi:oligopeptide transport system substrate-binding protein